MSKYRDSYSIHAKCRGCDRTFMYKEGALEEERCLVYANPSRWWVEKPVVNVMKTVYVTKSERRIEVPAAVFQCPMATHLEEDEKEKKKINPLKASKRGNRR
jgi:hypothetical protein